MFACNRIKQFYKDRSRDNEAILFFQLFGIKFNKEMYRFLVLSFRTSEVDYPVLEKISSKVFYELSKIGHLQSYGITENIIRCALSELYRPRYYENEWSFSIHDIFLKIKKQLIFDGNGEYIANIENLFEQMNPLSLKCERNGQSQDDETNSLIPDEITQGEEVEFSQRKVSVSRKTNCDETLLTRQNILKDSEVKFVKEILALVGNVDNSIKLPVNIYENDRRHPMITNFINSVKSYNRVSKDKNEIFKNRQNEMKIIIRVLKDTGKRIIFEYEKKLANGTDTEFRKAS
jgi:hypothetical protein